MALKFLAKKFRFITSISLFPFSLIMVIINAQSLLFSEKNGPYLWAYKLFDEVRQSELICKCQWPNRLSRVEIESNRNESSKQYDSN